MCSFHRCERPWILKCGISTLWMTNTYWGLPGLTPIVTRSTTSTSSLAALLPKVFTTRRNLCSKSDKDINEITFKFTLIMKLLTKLSTKNGFEWIIPRLQLNKFLILLLEPFPVKVKLRHMKNVRVWLAHLHKALKQANIWWIHFWNSKFIKYSNFAAKSIIIRNSIKGLC